MVVLDVRRKGLGFGPMTGKQLAAIAALTHVPLGPVCSDMVIKCRMSVFFPRKKSQTEPSVVLVIDEAIDERWPFVRCRCPGFIKY